MKEFLKEFIDYVNGYHLISWTISFFVGLVAGLNDLGLAWIICYTAGVVATYFIMLGEDYDKRKK